MTRKLANIVLDVSTTNMLSRVVAARSALMNEKWSFLYCVDARFGVSRRT